jgi:hypothetical protein
MSAKGAARTTKRVKEPTAPRSVLRGLINSLLALTAVSLMGFDDPVQEPAKYLEQVMAASKENSRKSANWLGREDIRQYLTRKGHRRLLRWTTYEASKVEGENYYKVIAEGGKPLSKSAQKREQEKLDGEAKWRRNTPPGERGRPSAKGRYSISLSQIIAFHQIRFSGEDTINGRTYRIIDTRLRDFAPHPHDPDDLALAGDATIWVDKETNLIVMQELRFKRQWLNWDIGSYVRYDMFWNGEVMLIKRIFVRLDGLMQENEQIYSNYRKFGSEANIKFEGFETPPPD